MKSSKESLELKAYLDSLSPIQRRKAYLDIQIGCKITRPTLYHWARGIGRIQQLYKDKIEEVLGAKVFSEEFILKK